MADGPSKVVVRQVRTLFALGSVAAMTDGQLLERFTAGCDDDAELAFAALVDRHGPMVLGVCRRILADRHDAEDAFQATFLVLVRKSRSDAIARGGLLAPWLYGVAIRTAWGARVRARRQRARESQVVDRVRAKDRPEVVEHDLRAVLDEELSRLPERYRTPLVLCELEGKSRKEAAGLIGVPEGTVSSRLARGREILRQRLGRRGLAPAAGALAAVLSREGAAAVPATLVEETVRAATCFAAGPAAAVSISAAVVALTEGVLKTMLLTKLKVMATVLALGVVATGVGVLAQAPSPSSTVGQPAPSTRVGEAQGDGLEANRLREVERKLDRVLEALEPRGGVGAGRGVRYESELTPVQESTHPRQQPVGVPKAPYGGRPQQPGQGRSDSERLSELERRIDRVEQTLDEVQGRLNRLEAANPPRGRADRPAPGDLPR